MKTISLEELENKYIGKKGTKNRNEYDKELKKELAKEKKKQVKK